MSQFFELIGHYIREQWSRLKVRSAEEKRLEDEVHRAIERVVDQSDPRIRGIMGYRHKLFDSVATSLRACSALAARIPGPVQVDPRTWATDPLINALFGSVERMRWVLSSPEVRQYVKDTALQTEDCFAFLLALPQVRTQLGMELLGDAVQRDVRQTTVSFANQEVVLPGPDADTVRRLAAGAIMDTLVGLAVAEITAQEERIAELEERLRIVRLKQKVLRPRAQGVDFVSEGGGSHLADYNALGKRILELEKDLAEARKGLSTVDDYLDRLNAELRHPEQLGGAKLERIRLDRMNVVREETADGDDAVELEFLRGYRRGQPGRVLLLIRFPRSELIADQERLAAIEHYVNA